MISGLLGLITRWCGGKDENVGEMMRTRRFFAMTNDCIITFQADIFTCNKRWRVSENSSLQDQDC